MIRFKTVEYEISDTVRAFVAGSSGAGKTTLIEKILLADLFPYKQLLYCHPDFHNEVPVSWNLPGKQLFFQAGLPSKSDILELAPGTVLILDDLFQLASESYDIDYLFRVLSGKRKIHVFILTQRYFANGRFSVSIRNSSNYHILMSNADATVNSTAARKMGLKREITKAIDLNRSKPFPYIFVDRTPAARISGLCVFIDIFKKKVIINDMLYYLFTEADFNNSFKKIEDNIAVRNDGNTSSTISANSNPENQESTATRNQKDYHSHYARRRQVTREVQRALRRYKKRTEL